MRLKSPANWLILIVPVALLTSSVLLALALPTDLTPDHRFQQTADGTMAPTRPGLAPPATRMNVMNATPEFATSVPLALTQNFDANQFALGRRTYTQWCATCHGDRGQGLALWRSSWDPEHQDCARSGCHGRRPPPDGFTMLKVPPPLIGPNTLMTFETAFQLYYFVRATMPFQAPGTLSDEEYWAVAAFLADQHGADAAGRLLNDLNALSVTLH
jgi:mono/diheme cytochrome c family protein